MANLKDAGVSDLMLSWTLGGYPSINLKIASESLRDPSLENYKRILTDEFGEYAEMVYRSAKKFSDAFRAFPFDIHVLYRGPQNAGPSNLLYLEKTGFEATMTCYAYDDLDYWRSIYPVDVFLSQLKAVSDGFSAGLLEIKDMPDCLYKQCAEAAFAIFDSSYQQSLFISARDKNDKAAMLSAIQAERENAMSLYRIMQNSALFGYEAANHYYYNKGMLAEKVINCAQIAQLK